MSFFSLICAMRCDEDGASCNAFRVDSGSCTWGFLPPPSEDDESEDTDVEVYLKLESTCSLENYETKFIRIMFRWCTVQGSWLL